MNERLGALSAAGVSIWLDDLSRSRLRSGNLAHLIQEFSVTGVTTNPTIFAAALSEGSDYETQLADLGGVPAEVAITELCAADVRDACDEFAGTYRDSAGYDGRVSIEVSPTLANDARGTIEEAAKLHELVDRENVLIKIPATDAGLEAIEETIASGISVNVTLIFSVRRYVQVMEAYVRGLERARERGLDLSGIHSVASFFISRVDGEIDARLRALGRSDLVGRAAVANALVAYGAFEEFVASERFEMLAASGANIQRPLWASTGTKDPAYPDTLYVSDLVGPEIVNTMPEKTLRSFADHGTVNGSVEGRRAEGQALLDEVEAAGVDLDEVFELLEAQGVEKFLASWAELVERVEAATAALGTRA